MEGASADGACRRGGRCRGEVFCRLRRLLKHSRRRLDKKEPASAELAGVNAPALRVEKGTVEDCWSNSICAAFSAPTESLSPIPAQETTDTRRFCARVMGWKPAGGETLRGSMRSTTARPATPATPDNPTDTL